MIHSLTEYLIIQAEMEDEMNFPDEVWLTIGEVQTLYKIAGDSILYNQQRYIHESKVGKLEQQIKELEKENDFLLNQWRNGQPWGGG